MARTTLRAMLARYLRYTFDPVEWKQAGLTSSEKEIIPDQAAMDRLRAWCANESVRAMGDQGGLVAEPCEGTGPLTGPGGYWLNESGAPRLVICWHMQMGPGLAPQLAYASTVGGPYSVDAILAEVHWTRVLLHDLAFLVDAVQARTEQEAAPVADRAVLDSGASTDGNLIGLTPGARPAKL